MHLPPHVKDAKTNLGVFQEEGIVGVYYYTEDEKACNHMGHHTDMELDEKV